MKTIPTRMLVKLLRDAGTEVTPANQSGDSVVTFNGVAVFSHLATRKKDVPAGTYCDIRRRLRRFGLELPPVSAVGR